MGGRSKKTKAILASGLFGAIILTAFILYLIVNKPAPLAQGSCYVDCDTFTQPVDYEDLYGGFDAEAICGSGCLIDTIKENVAMMGYTVTCKCCDCLGSQSADLGQCAYGIEFLDAIAEAMGLCKNYA